MRLNVFQFFEDDALAAFGAANTSANFDEQDDVRLAKDRSVVAQSVIAPVDENTALPRGSFLSVVA